MTITGRDLLRQWNATKGTNFSYGTESSPSLKVSFLQKRLDEDSECFFRLFR